MNKIKDNKTDSSMPQHRLCTPIINGNRSIFCFNRLAINNILMPKLILSLILAIPCLAFAANPPELTLAKKYTGGINLSNYWVSEKYDGIRAYWDSKNLISRNGNIFNAPTWFTADFPTIPMDGELWINRHFFEETVSIVNRHQPHLGWEKIKYMVFDLPTASGDFDSRLQRMQQLADSQKSQFLVIAKHEKLIDEQALFQKLDDITALGGEGLMLRRTKSLYTAGRSMNLLKLKKFEDAEAIVLKHNTGQGKYQNMMGSITVQDANGQIFKIGSGFSDQERRQPPSLGSSITFKYQGHYKTGTPRFPVFWRQHNTSR